MAEPNKKELARGQLLVTYNTLSGFPVTVQTLQQICL